MAGDGTNIASAETNINYGGAIMSKQYAEPAAYEAKLEKVMAWCKQNGKKPGYGYYFARAKGMIGT